MANERTFSMLKPGVLQRRIAGEIIHRMEQKGFHITALKIMNISRELCETHYAEHKDKPFFPGLVKYMTSGPVIAMVLEGEKAISHLRMLCGATNVDEAKPGTIRGDYASVTRMNIIHASDSVESAEREINLFFKPEEIVEYVDDTAKWLE
jgi:nucleoside-diphosphate kinase